MHEKIKLPNVTIVAMTSIKVYETIKAIQYSMKNIEFGDAIIITHCKPILLPSNIKYKHIDKLKSIDDFNYNMVYKLGNYINTDYALVVHYDGFVVNPQMWDKKFLEYDYIGAPWPLPPEDNPIVYRDVYGNICRVGNSVSIRSKKLLDFPYNAGIPWTGQEWQGKMYYHEDGFICCTIKHILEAEGMAIAPLDIAAKFGREHSIPENLLIEPFVFHKWRNGNKHYPDFSKRNLIRSLVNFYSERIH